MDIADFSFNKDAVSLGDTHLNIAVRKLNVAIRIGLRAVVFTASNANWGMVSDLVSVFDQISGIVCDIVGAIPESQETTLALHVSLDTVEFPAITASFVNKALLGDALFYGISLHRSDSTLVIDKSLRYEGAAFVRLQRRFAGETPFGQIASRLYEDELVALRLLGVTV